MEQGMVPFPHQIDLYAELGVSPTATEDQIREAYRLAVRQCNPDGDQLPGMTLEAAVDQFARINLAYLVLGDPSLRWKYDNARLRPNPLKDRFDFRRHRERWERLMGDVLIGGWQQRHPELQSSSIELWVLAGPDMSLTIDLEEPFDLYDEHAPQAPATPVPGAAKQSGFWPWLQDQLNKVPEPWRPMAEWSLAMAALIVAVLILVGLAALFT